MKTNQLVKPSELEEKVFSITDFSTCTDFCPFLSIGEQVKTIKQNVALLRNCPNGTQTAYYVNTKWRNNFCWW